MLNEKYYPFERNHYYYGKLLTAKDFEDEQTYLNNKRRLMNRLLGGNGIVCGLSVYTPDDESIVIETGVAIDEGGREILVEEPVIKKLITFEGFDEIEGNEVYLGIEYAEEGTEKTYAPMSEDGEEAHIICNKVKEKYRLFLIEEEKLHHPISLLEKYIEEEILYEDEEIRIKQYTPRYVNYNAPLKVKVVLEKVSGIQKEYNFKYTLQLQGFRAQNGKRQLEVDFKGCKLKSGEQIVKAYILQPEECVDKNLQFYISKESFYLLSHGRQSNVLDQNVKFNLIVQKAPMWDWVSDVYYKQSLDEVKAGSTGRAIYLAKIKLIRAFNKCTIEQIEMRPFKQYVYHAKQLMITQQLKEYYPNNIEVGEQTIHNVPQNTTVNSVTSHFNTQDYFTTGIVEIPVGLNSHVKETIISDEIMHGLGPGSVYIDIGIEYIKEEGEVNSSEIILGDASLFDEVREKPFKFKHGIKIFKEKGTFVVAVRLEEVAKLSAMRMRWYAFKVPERNEQVVQNNLEGRMMIVSPDTVVVAPHETVTFSPVFFNMEAVPCRYEVFEEDGGTITNMGVYTAPSKSGVYTIQIQTLSENKMTAHAFVVVDAMKGALNKEGK